MYINNHQPNDTKQNKSPWKFIHTWLAIASGIRISNWLEISSLRPRKTNEILIITENNILEEKKIDPSLHKQHRYSSIIILVTSTTFWRRTEEKNLSLFEYPMEIETITPCQSNFSLTVTFPFYSVLSLVVHIQHQWLKLNISISDEQCSAMCWLQSQLLPREREKKEFLLIASSASSVVFFFRMSMRKTWQGMCTTNFSISCWICLHRKIDQDVFIPTI